jgi:hypothetical protein
MKIAAAAPPLVALALAACADQGPSSAVTYGAPASAVATSGRSCFRPDEVTNFTAPNDRVVNVRAGARVYQMTLMGTCPDVDWSMRLGIQATGSSWICSGLDATIIAPSPIGAQRCPVTNIRQLSPQEVAALAPRDRP